MQKMLENPFNCVSPRMISFDLKFGLICSTDFHLCKHSQFSFMLIRQQIGQISSHCKLGIYERKNTVLIILSLNSIYPY